MTNHMAGSLLPSHDATVLKHGVINGWTFTIEPVEQLQTYALKVEGSTLAMHPNGFSLKELVKRIADYNATGTGYSRAVDQWDYILACGGQARSQSVLTYYLGGEARRKAEEVAS